MTTPTTPETLLAEAIRLNSERTQGEWRWADWSDDSAEDGFTLESPLAPHEIKQSRKNYTEFNIPHKILTVEDCEMRNEKDKEFIANAPTVYDAYIAQAKVMRELVEALKYIHNVSESCCHRDKVSLDDIRAVGLTAYEALKKAGAL